MVRGDKRRQMGVRGDILGRSDGFAGEVAGSPHNMTVRDISSAIGSITPEDSEQAISELRGVITGPVARAIFEIGRFIDGEGTYNGP